MSKKNKNKQIRHPKKSVVHSKVVSYPLATPKVEPKEKPKNPKEAEYAVLCLQGHQALDRGDLAHAKTCEVQARAMYQAERKSDPRLEPGPLRSLAAGINQQELNMNSQQQQFHHKLDLEAQKLMERARELAGRTDRWVFIKPMKDLDAALALFNSARHELTPYLEAHGRQQLLDDIARIKQQRAESVAREWEIKVQELARKDTQAAIKLLEDAPEGVDREELATYIEQYQDVAVRYQEQEARNRKEAQAREVLKQIFDKDKPYQQLQVFYQVKSEHPEILRIACEELDRFQARRPFRSVDGLEAHLKSLIDIGRKTRERYQACDWVIRVQHDPQEFIRRLELVCMVYAYDICGWTPGRKKFLSLNLGDVSLQVCQARIKRLQESSCSHCVRLGNAMESTLNGKNPWASDPVCNDYELWFPERYESDEHSETQPIPPVEQSERVHLPCQVRSHEIQDHPWTEWGSKKPRHTCSH